MRITQYYNISQEKLTTVVVTHSATNKDTFNCTFSFSKVTQVLLEHPLSVKPPDVLVCETTIKTLSHVVHSQSINRMNFVFLSSEVLAGWTE